MGINNKLLFKRILRIIVAIAITSFMIQGVLKLTYANSDQGEPDVIITVDENGHVDYVGNLFGNQLWYPGIEKNGVIRIINNYETAKISDIGLAVDIIKVKDGYDKTEVYNSFLKNMNLTIKKGSLFVFEDTIVDRKSLNELCNGLQLDNAQQFIISNDYPADLEYTLRMDEKSGDELERLKATVEFKLGVTGGN